MEQVLTIKCKLKPTPEQSLIIDETLKAFADACTWIHINTDPKICNNVVLQSLVYHDVRSLFGLSANLTVRALARVASNRKTAKALDGEVKAFNPTSIDYDARIFDYREKDNTVSLTLLSGRARIPLIMGRFQIDNLSGRKPTSATLCKSKGVYYIHIQVKEEPPKPPKPSSVIGVDFGRTDIAHTSDGDKWDGKDIQQFRDKCCRVRKSLNQKASKGTRSTRRRCRQTLQRLSGREKRYQSWLSHGISKTIVLKAVETNSMIAIEDLTGIRERTNQLPRTKTERRRSNSWAFFQLRQYMEYKAIKFGVKLITVNPAYTSQTCHICNHIGDRNGKSFGCDNCGWHGDADFNGAMNIKAIGLTVIQPRGPWLACGLQGSQKPRLYSLAS
jgi:putative transposase